MKISKTYSRNKNLGNYESVRVGITLEKEISDVSGTKLKKISNVLFELGKKLVDDELKTEMKKED